MQFYAAINVNHSALVSNFIYLHCIDSRKAISVSEIIYFMSSRLLHIICKISCMSNC